MTFVVDCSVAARWFLADGATPYSDAVFDLLEDRPVVAPSLLWPEFANVFLELSRQRKLPHAMAQGAVQRFGALGIMPDTHLAAPERLFLLGDEYGISAYDASYLELALRLGCPLASCDEGLKHAALRAGLFLAVE